MITTFRGKRITGVLGVLPENEYDYDIETKPFQTTHTKRLKRIMGYGKRRAAKSTTTTSDLCVFGMDYILEQKWINKDEIGAIIAVTISPDHYVPHVSGKEMDQIDWFLFHQPNKFMLQKLADKLKVPYEKMPMNVVGDFGNSNSNTVPFAMASNLADKLKDQTFSCCMSGFGAGLTWAAAILTLGNMNFCELIISDL